MMRFLFIFSLTFVYSYSASFGIFPSNVDLGLTLNDYYLLCGFLGLLCSHAFFDKVFR